MPCFTCRGGAYLRKLQYCQFCHPDPQLHAKTLSESSSVYSCSIPNHGRCSLARSITRLQDFLWEKSKKSIEKSMLHNVFEEIVFTCGLCELVSCCTCKSHTAQSCCFLVWDQIMHFFCQKKDNISRLVGIPKEGHQVSGLMRSREGVILRTIGTWMGPYKGLQDGGRHRNCCPPPSSCSSHQSSRQEAL